MELFLILILISIIVLILANVEEQVNKEIKKISEDKKKSMEGKFNTISDFSPSQKIIGEDINSGIAVDEGRKKVCFIKRHAEGIESDVLSYQDILSSEISEDSVTVTKTARSSQLGGALIGGLALGGTGAIIGGLSGKKTSSNKVSKINLSITVNRTRNPIHNINFMNVESEKDKFIYKNAMKQAQHWHALMVVLIKQADSEDAEKVEETPKPLSDRSVADELAKLDKLRKQGLLTNEEFLSQKAKLLS